MKEFTYKHVINKTCTRNTIWAESQYLAAEQIMGVPALFVYGYVYDVVGAHYVSKQGPEQSMIIWAVKPY